MLFELTCLISIVCGTKHLKANEIEILQAQTYEILMAESNIIVGDVDVFPISINGKIFIKHTHSGGIGCEVHDFFIVSKDFHESDCNRPEIRIIFENNPENLR